MKCKALWVGVLLGALGTPALAEDVVFDYEGCSADGRQCERLVVGSEGTVWACWPLGKDQCARTAKFNALAFLGLQAVLAPVVAESRLKLVDRALEDAAATGYHYNLYILWGDRPVTISTHLPTAAQANAITVARKLIRILMAKRPLLRDRDRDDPDARDFLSDSRPDTRDHLSDRLPNVRDFLKSKDAPDVRRFLRRFVLR